MCHTSTHHNTQSCVSAMIVSVVIQRSHRYVQAVASTQYHGSNLVLSFVFRAVVCVCAFVIIHGFCLSSVPVTSLARNVVQTCFVSMFVLIPLPCV